jgi:heavy metal sensor kinase
MFFEKFRKLWRTLAFRLTLWYAGIFVLSSLAAFLVFYVSFSSVTRWRTDRELSNEITEFSFLFTSQGMGAVKANIALEAESQGVKEVFFRVVTPDGKELASSNLSPWKSLPVDGTAVKRIAGGSGRVFLTLTVPGLRHNVRVAYGSLGPGAIMQIGQSLADDEAFMEILREIFGITLAALMGAAVLIGWFMARRALQGLEEITRTATKIAGGALELRVPVKARSEEIDRLATTFNIMLDRIHALITGMREMTDNIAHDLRSPITRMRGIAEMALTTGGEAGEHEALAATTIEECDRLLEMINTMLDITETEAGVSLLTMEDVDIAALARDASELFQPLAEDKAITLVTDAAESSVVRGNVQRLQRMVANLLDNALKYTSPRGRVTVSVRDNGETVTVTVSDTGIGISGKDLPHIFKRFYRGDSSRSQAGAGLGLSLAQAVAVRHGGTLAVASSPGKGSVFTVTLPQQPYPRITKR